MDEERIEKEEKNPNAEIVIENRFFKWVENFWFYHKWHLLVVAFIVLVVIVVANQFAVKDSDDIVLLTAGPLKLSATQRESVLIAFEQALPEDFNQDGEKAVGIAHTEVYSKEQLIEFQEQYKEENGQSAVINTSLNSDNLKGFHNLIMAGEFSVCIIDKWLYEDVKEAGGFRPLSELYPEGVPQGAVVLDEYAINFKSTAFAKSFSCFEDFSDDTVICLRTKGVMSGIFNQKENEAKYLNAEAMFKAIIEFKPAE